MKATDELSDVEVLAQVATGDPAALEVLYRRHALWLLRRLSRRCGDPELVDEVVQDTFVAVWREASRFAGRGEVPAWIWGIGIRRLVDAVRRAKPRPVWAGGGVVDPVEESAEDRVLQAVEYGDVGAALNRLSPELRAVVQATLLDGLSTREAAHLLGIPAGTVKTRMMRARSQLREALT